MMKGGPEPMKNIKVVNKNAIKNVNHMLIGGGA